MFRYVDASDQGVHYMPSRDLVRTDWNLPRATEVGYIRTMCRGYMGSGASLAIGILPVGQRSPVHLSTGEHLLLGLEGEVTWSINDAGQFVTGSMDLIFIGSDQTYEYWNSGFETARFVDVIGRVAEWPHSAVYRDIAGQESVVVGHND